MVVYAARWEAELLFRELKSVYRIDQMASGNRQVTETLIYAARLTLTISHRLHRELIGRDKLDPLRLPFDRRALLFATVADELLVLSLRHRDRTWRARRVQSFADPKASRGAGRSAHQVCGDEARKEVGPGGVRKRCQHRALSSGHPGPAIIGRR